jgi:hypothetical protein
MVATAFRTGRPAVAITGNTTRNIAEELPIQIERRPTSMGAQLAEIQDRHGRRKTVRTKGNAATDNKETEVRERGSSRALATEVPAGETRVVVGAARAAGAETESAIEAFPEEAPHLADPAHLVEVPAASAAAARAAAVHAVPPAWEALVVAPEVVAAGGGDEWL